MAVRRSSYISKKTGKLVWICDYRDQHGKRHELSFATRKEAEAELDRVRTEVRSRAHTADSDSIPLDKAKELFISMLEEEGAAPATIDEYEVYYRNHVGPFLGTRRLSRISAPDIQRFLDELRDRGRSADTRRRAKKTIGAILDEMVRQGYAAFNAAKAMRPRRRARRVVIEEREEIVIPQPEEMRLLMGYAGDERPLLAVLSLAGLRIGEARGLPWPFVDLDDGFIRVEQAADRFDNLGPVKTFAGRPWYRLARGLSSYSKNGSSPAQRASYSLFFRPKSALCARIPMW